MARPFLLLALAGTCTAIVVQRPPAMRPPGQQPRLSRRSEMLAAEAAAKSPEDGDSSMLSSTSNLVKSIVGSGVFNLPFGIAAYSSSRLALLPALALLGAVTLLSAYCFVVVARVVEATGASSWAEAWSRTVGERSSWLPGFFVGGLCFSAQLQYTMILGDTFSAIFAGLGLPWLGTRTGSILALTGLVTLPLSLLPNMSMLRYSSSLGVVSLLYTAAFMAWRAAGGHYAPGTPLHAAVPAAVLQPFFAAAGGAGGGGGGHYGGASSLLAQLLSPRTFKLVSILASAMVATFLAPQFFADLAPAPPPTTSSTPSTSSALATSSSAVAAPSAASSTSRGSAKLRRFRTLTAWGYAISALLTAVVMAAGYLTFGGASDGFVLNNYATTDRFAQLVRNMRRTHAGGPPSSFPRHPPTHVTLTHPPTPPTHHQARLAVGGSIVCSYPLMHQGLRAVAREALLARDLPAPRVGVTVCTVGLTTALALALTDLGPIAALSGAVISNCLAYVLPALMLEALLSRRAAAAAAAARGGGLTRGERLELMASRAIVALGLGLAAVGVYAVLT